MFISYSLLKSAYIGLIKLDSSTGKSRKEKISGLRYLIATSRLLYKTKSETINLAVGSDYRHDFVNAVGEVVALNTNGLYTKDFAKELDTSNDYGVGSNFLTTRLANSRFQDVKYPGRPAHLLFLETENVSILKNINQTLSDYYGIDNIKSELCIWLLRNEEFDIQQSPEENKLLALFKSKLSSKYTSEVVDAIIPSPDEIKVFTSENEFSEEYFCSTKPGIESLFAEDELEAEDKPLIPVRVLVNDLDDDDEIYQIVQQLLARGTKGLLFSGPPGTSKTWYALKVALKIINGNENKLERVQFHPSFTYEDFIEGLVSTASIGGAKPLFEPKDKLFLNLCTLARKNPDSLYILIIDEFSRGDPSKIFGELLTYIEPDYREIKFKLPYSEKEISIPHNVVIFATMNPYDKSVVDLDSAMERRFDVIELLPNVNILRKLLQESEIKNELLGRVVDFFNAANRLSPHGFGHTYFKGLKEEIDFILLWNHKLKFIFEKMFRFKDDAYNELKQSYLGIISDNNKDKIL